MRMKPGKKKSKVEYNNYININKCLIWKKFQYAKHYQAHNSNNYNRNNNNNNITATTTTTNTKREYNNNKNTN